VLRIEDTDQARSSESSARGILEDLAWLGIRWDEGPEFTLEGAEGVAGKIVGGDPRGVGSFYQSRRRDSYNKYLVRLVAEGKAYPAFETAADLDAKRKAAVARKETYRYDRAAIAAIPTPAERLARMKAADAEGTPYVIRFLMPDDPVHVTDEVLGEVKYAAGEVDDFVIRKADGFPTYHFAVVVDDEEMGVTHVLRGQEHLNNTPRHVALQKALGFATPKYGHMPLITNMDSSKMSKRDKDKAVREACKKAGIKGIAGLAGVAVGSSGGSGVGGGREDGIPAALQGFSDTAFQEWLKDTQRQLPADVLVPLAGLLRVTLPEVEVHDFRKAGYLPEVICNFIALLGWSPGENVEKFNMAFLATKFDFPRIGKTNAKFDRVKLASFNKDAMGAMTPEVFCARFGEWCRLFEARYTSELPPERFALLAEALRARCKTFGDAAEQGRFVLTPDDEVEYDQKAVAKTLRAAKEGEASGLDVLREVLPVLVGLTHFGVAEVQAAVEGFAAAKGLGIGAVAQPLRVAVTGTGVSPPLGETLAVLGKESSVRRIERCVRSTSGPTV